MPSAAFRAEVVPPLVEKAGGSSYWIVFYTSPFSEGKNRHHKSVSQEERPTQAVAEENGEDTGRARSPLAKVSRFSSPLQREELAEMLQDALHSSAVEVGLLLAGKMLQDEVTRLCGQRYQRRAAT